ncbi:uncharacterized protein LOC108623115 [Ceratina calcarata]|uniref:Uncharacterized protein LOC108623115 n=1 Tax=Ceratina calcarata TaxID=156304 RepID=A0AAJ7N4A6_9HYME|nr:uncharacterized protein LOC108623115 [Ceratina calcarata]
MSVVLTVVPFFLVARVDIDSAVWNYGPEYTFQVHVNSTAIPEEGSYMSIRLNVASKLVCQPKGYLGLSCHFRDSQADSYATESLDPVMSAVPIGPVSRQEAYELSREQFEIKFSEQGLDSLVVNENIQPRELDMIRVIVGQLNIGVLMSVYGKPEFEVMENFTLGECMTTFTMERSTVGHSFRINRGYVLETLFNLKDGQLVQIRKIRNLLMCTHKMPYFFGSAESMREISDMVSSVVSSESHAAITSTEFISGTTNVVTTSKVSESTETTLYEHISLRLESILPAESEPPEVKDPESASMFIGRWLAENSMEEDSIEMDSPIEI